jgi:phage terminase small subunit
MYNKRKTRRLTQKQAEFFKNLCKGLSGSEAARKAGYSPNHVPQQAHVTRERIRYRVNLALVEAGLHPEGLKYKHILPALHAMETKTAAFEGKITDEREFINWTARLKAMELVAELGGYYHKPEPVPRGNFGEEVHAMPKVIDATIVRRASELPEKSSDGPSSHDVR